MSSNDAIRELPHQRTGRFLEWLDQCSLEHLIFYGAAILIGIISIISIIEYSLSLSGYHFIVDKDGIPVDSFWDFLYFNAALPTIGYGEFYPASIGGKVLPVFEALIVLSLFTFLITIIAVKALISPRNTIVFSKYAYYCTESERFLIIFLNTSNSKLDNVEMSSYFKLGGDWTVRPSITAPFITQSVQTFYINGCPKNEIIGGLRDGDCLRVGMAVGLGLARFSTSIQYNAQDIIVIRNRRKLVKYFEPKSRPGPVHLTDKNFRQMFNYYPNGALTLYDFVMSELRKM